MSFPPLNNSQKQRLDHALKAMGLNRSKVSEDVRTKYLLDVYSSKESARGTINHWARGMTALPSKFAKALEDIVGCSICELISGDEIVYPDELPNDEGLFEGASKQVTVNAYERNPEARQKCIDHFGYDCSVCGFNFAKIYGDTGKNFIHVHHLYDISLTNGSYEVDPIKHLRPVCPNCHSMLHKEKPALSIDALKEKLALSK